MRNATGWYALAVAALGLVLLPVQGQAQQQGGTLAERNEGIAQTVHNFSVTGGRGSVAGATTLTGLADYGEVCVYCHTPHGGSTDGPLWNRDATGLDFTGQMYSDNPGQSDLNMVYQAGPNPVSMACLTCHEGTIGIDVITNIPNASTATPGTGTTLGDYFGGATDGTQFRVLGADLRNDHPISMVYDPTQDDQFNTDIGILKLFGGGVGTGSVECATCHNPHTQNATFLRIPNGGSALCTTCHIK